MSKTLSDELGKVLGINKQTVNTDYCTVNDIDVDVYVKKKAAQKKKAAIRKEFNKKIHYTYNKPRCELQSTEQCNGSVKQFSKSEVMRMDKERKLKQLFASNISCREQVVAAFVYYPDGWVSRQNVRDLLRKLGSTKAQSSIDTTISSVISNNSTLSQFFSTRTNDYGVQYKWDNFISFKDACKVLLIDKAVSKAIFKRNDKLLHKWRIKLLTLLGIDFVKNTQAFKTCSTKHIRYLYKRYVSNSNDNTAVDNTAVDNTAVDNTAVDNTAVDNTAVDNTAECVNEDVQKSKKVRELEHALELEKVRYAEKMKEFNRVQKSEVYTNDWCSFGMFVENMKEKGINVTITITT